MNRDWALFHLTEAAEAFGLDIKSHACKVNSKVEWIVYATAAQCKEAFETMQSHGD